MVIFLARYYHLFSILLKTFILWQGVIVGYAIIVPCILINYIVGGGVSRLEFFLNFVGGVLFFTVGCLALANDSITTGVLTLGIGIIFFVDFGLVFKNSTFVTTTTMPR